MGTLEVILLQGKELKDVEKKGTQSPYCIFVCGDIRTRSQACKDGGRNPVWKEAFAFEITNQTELGILVMSESRSAKHATIGAAHIPLAEVEGKGWVDVTTPVTVNKTGKSQGALMLQMRYRMSHSDLSDYGDPPSWRGLTSPAVNPTSPGPAYPSSPPMATAFNRSIMTSELLSTSGSAALSARRLARARDEPTSRSAEVLLVQHGAASSAAFDAMATRLSDLPSISSSSSNLHTEDTGASGAHEMETAGSAHLRSSELRQSGGEPRAGGPEGLSAALSRYNAQRSPPRTQPSSSAASTVELELLKQQLTELTAQKAALEASLSESQDEAAALKNKISTISTMSFKDRKHWIEEKENLQLELLTLKQQLAEQTDATRLRQQHEELRVLRARVTELDVEVAQHKSLLAQQSRMASSEQLLWEQQGSVAEAVQQVEELSAAVSELSAAHEGVVRELEGHLDDTTTQLASSIAALQQDKQELRHMLQQLRQEQEGVAAEGAVPQEALQEALEEARQAHAEELRALCSKQLESERALELVRLQYEDVVEEKEKLQLLVEEVTHMKQTHVFMPQEEHLDLLAFQSRCAHLEAAAEGKQAELSRLLAEAEHNLASVQAERDSLQTSLSSSQLECQQLREAALQHESERKVLEGQVQELERRLGEAREQGFTQAREIDEARRQLEGREGEKAVLEGRCQDLEEQLEEAKEQAQAGMAALEEQLAGLRHQLQDQARELDQQRKQLGSERDRAEAAEEAAAAAWKQQEAAEKEAAKAREEVAEVQVKVMVMESDINTLRASGEAAQAARKEAEDKWQELKQHSAQQKEQLQEQIEEQRADILAMCRERDAAVKSLKSLQEQLHGSAAKADEQMIKELLEKNFELEMATEDMRHENDVLTQDLVASKLELARLREVETLFRREVYKANRQDTRANGRSMVA